MFRKKTTSRWERGQTLIVAALFMAVVMGFTAMAIDVGMFLEDRRQLQNGADAAVLAGVQFLPEQPDTAVSTARKWAANNGISNSEIESVTVTTTSYANDTLTVQFNRDFGWIFGRVLGKTVSDVPGRASAVVGSLGRNSNMMPWALLQESSPCLDDDGEAIYNSNCVVKVGAGGIVDGWYGALDFDGKGGGSAEYKANVIDGTTDWHYCIAGDPSPGCVSAVEVIDSLDGNKVGPTGSGINERMLDGDGDCDENGNGRDDFGEIFKPNPSSGPEYVVVCPDSPRLIIIPIVSYSSVPVHTVTLRGWSLAYLDAYWCAASAANLTGTKYAFALTDGGRLPVVVPVPPAAPPTPEPTPTPGPVTTTPVPTPSGSCMGTGHWEVQITLADAVYSEASGFMTAYDPGGGITVRRLVE